MKEEVFLIVDDKHEVLNLLKWEVNELGAKAFVADCCDKAIMLLRDVEFKAMFLDIVLGNETSERILKYLKSRENILNQNIRIILISGYINDSFVGKHTPKFFRIMEKPFFPDEISRVIKEVSQLS